MTITKIGGPGDHHRDRLADYIERVAQECIKWRPYVRSEILKQTNNPALADDVVDQAIVDVNAHAARHGLDKEIIVVGGYLLRTARNRLSDFYRQNKIETVSPDAEQNEVAQDVNWEATREIEKRVEAQEIIMMVWKAVSDVQKKVLEMALDGLNTHDIAMTLDISDSMARYHLSRIKAMVEALRLQGGPQ